MKRTLFLILPLVTIMASCGKPATDKWITEAINTAAYQTGAAADKFVDSGVFPRTLVDGRIITVDAYDWTSGFFPGSLWLAYQLTGNESLRDKAAHYTSGLHEVQYYKGNHDIGFMMFCSYGNQYLITGDNRIPDILVQSSESLLSRFDPRVGLIRSWDFGDWNYPVIIDNMMNLELLFWASEYTGDTKYHDIAVSHADKTMENHFRPDKSTYHVVSYNDDGSVEYRSTFQGYADESSWARGQAWGLYGYTMCYRKTGHERYLQMAKDIAALIMNNPSTPEDLIPYWDYHAPGIPDAPRDASAAAITASALLELSTFTEGKVSSDYYNYAEKILKSLSSEEYLAPKGENGFFILMHSTGHLPGNSEIDVPLNYADYYYLESLKRYLEINGIKAKA